ncbi:MAG TPA: hypothetical protein VMW40_04880 [Candidatus Bathyarchaeia archaeon]|nr:hypothetical protein [Candidatus Bathyarchaeia archaeon]
MPKKECNNGTRGLGTPVPHSFCIPASSHTTPKGIAGKGTIKGIEREA